MNQKGFTPVIVIIVIIVAVAGGAWYYNNTKIKTTVENKIITPLPPENPPSPTPPPNTNEGAEVVMPADTVILRVTNNGGRCSYGGCFSETTVRSSGGWTIVEGKKEARKGTVKKENILRIYQTANSTNFEEMRMHKFTNVCPSAYDGPHYIYVFLTVHGNEKIDSCITEIDENSLLFREVNSLLKVL